jgi:IS5 family transposase
MSSSWKQIEHRDVHLIDLRQRKDTPMRKSLLAQLPLVPVTIDHDHARELEAASVLLDQLPEATKLVFEDLAWRGRKRVDPTKGRHGMGAEQLLRVAILKQLEGCSYEMLAFHLADSASCRRFCRLGLNREPPKKATLQKNVKRVKPETWKRINDLLVLKAKELGIEYGEKVRTDCTVVESNIHHPTDSSLLWDSVRVLVRAMGGAKTEFGIEFHDHSRRAKRRSLGISHAKTAAQRKTLYRDLIKVTDKTVKQAEQVAQQLDQVEVGSILQMALAASLASDLRHYADLARKVIWQTERRVIDGETVPASEKLVSIFETHTDVIIKDNRETLYGHKLCLTSGASGLVTDVVVEQGNPADSTLAVKMIERQRDLYGKVPRQACFDGGFASRDNLAAIKELGVKDVAFHKRCRLEVEDMVKSTWVYRQLRAFRAGIEGIISFLKRGFGLGRCAWRGFQSFQAYVQASVVACNLLIMARHALAAAKAA